MIDWQSIHGESFSGARVLVTGGAGFIGSHLIETLVALGADVVAFDDLSGGDWANLDGFGDGVEQITASITDAEAIGKATAGCRFVFHQAALGSVPRSLKEPELYYDVNVIGTVNVLQAARAAGVGRVMFAGSSSAYGNPPGDGSTPKVETMPPLPLSPYAATKLAGEHAMRAWANSYGVDTAVLRYFNIFGPRQNPHSAYAAVIAAFAKALHVGRPGVIFGDGEQSRDFTFVANAVHANLLAARHDGPLLGEVFNVAVGGRVSVNELYQRMAARYGHADLAAVHQPSRGGDVLHSQADMSKTKRTLGYEPLVDFDTGLAATCDWYKQNLARQE
ncbi:MAG: NAD-dependent epimerase/dehydratase family protein [Phycisphaera sp.]|nr:NAD-dependent epimerase/dehydratase family protein [Phycisphaera sp.]